MKSIFIISTYPSDPKKMSILKDCLKSTKNMGFDVCLTTNYKIIDPEIYELVDYLIWDKTDIQTLTDYGIFPGPGWFLNGMNFRATMSFDNAYHFDLYRCLHNGVSLADGLGYDFFYYLEGDRIIMDKENILLYRNKMFENNKKMIFSEVKIKDEISGADVYSYMTHLFGGIPSDFLEATKKIPYNIEEWVTNHELYGHSMEIIFYHNILNKENIYFVDYEKFNNFLSINKSRKVDDYGFNLMFFFEGEDMYLLIHNNINLFSKNEIYINDVLWLTQNLGPRCYYIEKLNKNNFLNKTIKNVVTIENETSIFEKILTESKLNALKNSQKIIFKK